MYSTCIFCHSSLGANESIEHFPIGRRLAFDAARGRLWVVCRRCQRWNLSPLDERWEATDECERLFSTTRTRVSTDNIGLARVHDGLELVRIGSPMRPEMAAWRYGDQLGRRRRKHLVWTGAAIASAVAVVVLGPAMGLITTGGWGAWNAANSLSSVYRHRRVRARIYLPSSSDVVRVRLPQLNRLALLTDEEGWALRLPFEASPSVLLTLAGGVPVKRESSVLLRGDDALRVAGQLLPAINSAGAKRMEVNEAVRMIEDAPDPESLFKRYSKVSSFIRTVSRGEVSDEDGRLVATLPKEVRLALEMATHEESERRALEGELAVLEAAWKNAEEIAAIADDMFVSDDTRARLAALKGEG